MVDVCAQRSGFAKQRQELAMEVDRAERRCKELKDQTGGFPRGLMRVNDGEWSIEWLVQLGKWRYPKSIDGLC